MSEGGEVRPGRPKSERKNEAILQAATELFLEHGFQGTAMDAVARRAGVSKQTVYSHFENKEALFAACVRAKVTRYGFDEVATVPDDDLRDALLAAVRQAMEMLTDPEVVAAHRMVIAEAISQPGVAKRFYESGPRRTFAWVGELLTREVTRGRLAIAGEVLPYAASQLLFGAFGPYQFEFWLGLRDRIPGDELDRHLGRVVDDFLRLYGVRGEGQLPAK